MKFAHIADAHIGRAQFNQPLRYDDYVKAFRETIERAVRERVDFILIAGDLFHVSKPSPKALRDAIEVLSIPKRKGIPVFAIEGNHDKTIRETSVFDLLEHLGLLYTVGLKRKPRESEFQRSERKGNAYLVHGEVGDIKIYGLRHYSRWQLIRGDRNLLKALFKGGDILMLHQAVDYLSADTPYAKAFDLHLNDLPDNFLYYALGHIHVARLAEPSKTGFSGPIVYPGSPERTEVREASHRIIYRRRLVEKRLEENRKGFYIVEDFQPEFVEIETRPFYSISVEGSSKEEFRRKLREIAPLLERDSVAVVTLEGTVKGGLSIAEVQDVLSGSALAYYTFHSRVSSEVVSTAGGLKEDELFTEWEREVLRHLTAEPKEFRESIDGFLEWLKESFEKKPVEAKKPEKEERKPKPAEPRKVEKRSESKKPPKGTGLDAWLRRG
ncbi:metallophosphoesterase family protein [Thermococcus sp.]